MLIALGVLLLWLRLILWTLTEVGGRDEGGILGVPGSLFASLVPFVGALGSKWTTDYPNLAL